LKSKNREMSSFAIILNTPFKRILLFRVLT
jgi:hypothetical protein